MDPLPEFLSQYGALMVCLAVFAEQIGLPIPSTLVLLAVGAAAGTGELQPGGVFLLAVLGGVAADLIWYGIGRVKGLPYWVCCAGSPWSLTPASGGPKSGLRATAAPPSCWPSSCPVSARRRLPWPACFA